MASKYEFDAGRMEPFYRHPEQYRMKPFRIFGGLYFVGNRDGASYLCDTGSGLILFDTNYPTAAALLVHSIWECGFDPAQIRYIFHTHGHFDHIGATGLLKALSGAKTCLGRADAEMFRQRPELMLADCCRHAYVETFQPDLELEDGDVVSLGDVSVRALWTPGHTPGAMTYLFRLREGDVEKTVGLHGGAGLNTLCAPFLRRYHLSGMREQFDASLDRCLAEKVDIFIGNHTAFNDTEGKYARMLAQPGENPFLDESAWGGYIQSVRSAFQTMLAEEPLGEL